MSVSTISSNNSGYDESLASKTHNAEREANHQIDSARKRIEKANLEADQAINEIKDQYTKQEMVEFARHTNKIETERSKGYEQLRDLQRGQQSELRKLRREGDRDISQLQEHYRNLNHDINRSGEQHVRDIQNEYNSRMNQEKLTSDDQYEQIKSQNEDRANLIRKSSEEQIARLSETTRSQFEDAKTKSTDATLRMQTQFAEKEKQVTQEKERKFNEIQERASQSLKDIRRDTADKLSAYRARQNDPFYKLLNLETELTETADEYILKAQIPEYEQQHISASVKGNNLVINGYRRNEEILDHGNGHKQGTSSFQSYHESFPLRWPVESKRLSRETEGDTVTIRVPKKSEHVYQTPQLKRPERVKAEPPQFPENIRKTPPPEKPREEDTETQPLLAKPAKPPLT